jgi:hypothetical protein
LPLETISLSQNVLQAQMLHLIHHAEDFLKSYMQKTDKTLSMFIFGSKVVRLKKKDGANVIKLFFLRH